MEADKVLPRLKSETNLDDVLQISNVFVNVSKGEVAKSGELQKAFKTTEVPDVVKEVCDLVSLCVSSHSLLSCNSPCVRY